ncbi:MAG: hypothetical protein NTV54_02905 [Ignavibacteriales bacterium]|nr:hypothetical protein [Ignavibacteriales bacterium]
MKSEELPSFLNSIRVQIPQPANAEEAVLSKIGVELYDAFYRNYTRKQWGMDPKDLDASVTMRLPIRMNDDRRYFTDPWQGIPKGGYTTLFDQMLRHKNIHLALNTDFKAVRNSVKYRKLIFTGPIDEYFDCVYGKLPYRSIEFRFEKLSQKYYQHMAVVNYPNEHEFTRCVEYKWLNGQHHDKTTISRDFPCWNDNEPYYPVPSIANKALFLKYKELADRTPNIFFCGRLGAYTYYNMDECVGQALDLFDKEIKNDGK